MSRGPVDQGRDYDGGKTNRWLYDYRDLTPFFHKGRNVIAASGAKFLFEAQLDKLTVKSDATWRTAPAQDVEGWQMPEFDAAAWPAAREVKENWPPLMASEIPPLMEAKYPVARVDGLPENKVFSQDVRKFGWILEDRNYHNFHTSYAIGWLQMLMDYYDYTGDKSLVDEMAPLVYRLLDTYTSWRGKNGLISEAPNYMRLLRCDAGCTRLQNHRHPPLPLRLDVGQRQRANTARGCGGGVDLGRG